MVCLCTLILEVYFERVIRITTFIIFSIPVKVCFNMTLNDLSILALFAFMKCRVTTVNNNFSVEAFRDIFFGI